MGFQHASASIVRTNEVLSADKPDRFALIDALRRAAPALSIGPSVVATVDALLSCLPPKRAHDMVFASNTTLVMRRNGISERTLRRHLAELVAAGLLCRIDSPNRKRYAKRDPERGVAMHFGLDLGPLFAAFGRLAALAQARDVEQQKVGYLRSKLRAALARHIGERGASPQTEAAYRVLRRQVSSDMLQEHLETFDCADMVECADTRQIVGKMSGSNGQNVRHQQSSEKELNDRKVGTVDPNAAAILTLADLTEACPEATAFLPEPVRSPDDVIRHARRLAPMMGIEDKCYEAAVFAKGALETALSIWVLLEFQNRIQRIGAYFRAITSGARSASFSATDAITRLLRQKALGCPRTTSSPMP